MRIESNPSPSTNQQVPGPKVELWTPFLTKYCTSIYCFLTSFKALFSNWPTEIRSGNWSGLSYLTAFGI